jgi:hypothetical protein
MKHVGIGHEFRFEARPQEIDSHIDRLRRPAEQGRHRIGSSGIEQRRQDTAMGEVMVGIGDELVPPGRRQPYHSGSCVNDPQAHPPRKVIARKTALEFIRGELQRVVGHRGSGLSGKRKTIAWLSQDHFL